THDEHDKAAAPCAGDLSSEGAIGDRDLVELVDLIGGNSWSRHFLRLPGIVEDLRHSVNIAGEQRIFHFNGIGLQAVHRRNRACAMIHDTRRLLFDDYRRIARAPGKTDHERRLEFISGAVGDSQRIDDYSILGKKLDEISAAEGRSILVLLAAG